MNPETVFEDVATSLVIFNEITFNRLWELGPDAYLLYSFYYRTAKFQRNKQPWANNAFVMKGLTWGKDRFKKAKNLLRDNGFLEDLSVRGNDGKIQKWVVKLNYLQQTIKCSPPCPEAHPVVLNPTNTHNYEEEIHITTNNNPLMSPLPMQTPDSLPEPQASSNQPCVNFSSGSGESDSSNTPVSERPTQMMATSTKKEFVDSKFEEFWQKYTPIHTGKGAKKVAREKFAAYVKKGTDPDEIIRGMELYILSCINSGAYTQNTVTFLNQEHWKDFLVQEQPVSFNNPDPFTKSDYLPEMDADKMMAVVHAHTTAWMLANPVWVDRIKRITNEVRNRSSLNYHQKSLQMALELAKDIFRYKDSPEVKNSLVDPLFWLSHRSVLTEIFVGTRGSGLFYVGYQLAKLAEEG